MARATDTLGKIDILVNNAGISYGAVPIVPMEKQPDEMFFGDLKAGLTDDQLTRLHGINLNSAFYC